MEKSQHSSESSLGRGWKASQHFPQRSPDGKVAHPDRSSDYEGQNIKSDGRRMGDAFSWKGGERSEILPGFKGTLDLFGDLDSAIERMNRSDLRLVSSALLRSERCASHPRALRILRELIMKSRTGTQLFLQSLSGELRSTVQQVSDSNGDRAGSQSLAGSSTRFAHSSDFIDQSSDSSRRTGYYLGKHPDIVH